MIRQYSDFVIEDFVPSLMEEAMTKDTIDNVNHPKHYKSHKSGVECIQVTEHMNFCLGNVMKYIWRSDHKNGLEDLKKAQWYLNREIERREKDNAEGV